MKKHFMKKIGGKYTCTSKTRKEDLRCSAGLVDSYSDCCEYFNTETRECRIGDLIESDHKNQDEDTRME